MKRLTNFNKFTLALVFTAISVISWGQTKTDPIDLNECTFTGVDDWYPEINDVRVISINLSYSETPLALNNDYTYQYYKNGVSIDPSRIQAEGFYKLVITGKGNYKGTINKDFYIVASHPLEGNGVDENHAYLIKNETDWIEFATNSAYWGDNVYVKLNNNVTVGAVDESGNIIRSGLMVGTAMEEF